MVVSHCYRRFALCATRIVMRAAWGSLAAACAFLLVPYRTLVRDNLEIKLLLHVGCLRAS